MSKSKQLKIVFPEHLYEILAAKSKDAGVTMAALVRLAVAEHYGIPDTTEDYLGPTEPEYGNVPSYSEMEKVVELDFLAKTHQEADEND